MHKTGEEKVCTSHSAQDKPHTNLTDTPNVSECHQKLHVSIGVAGSLFRAQWNESPLTPTPSALSATSTKWQTWTCSSPQTHRESHQSRSSPSTNANEKHIAKIGKTNPWASSCVPSEQMRLNDHAGFTPTHAETLRGRNDSKPLKKQSRWLHHSRRRNCRCWMRSKPNNLVVCERKVNLPT